MTYQPKTSHDYVAVIAEALELQIVASDDTLPAHRLTYHERKRMFVDFAAVLGVEIMEVFDTVPAAPSLTGRIEHADTCTCGICLPELPEFVRSQSCDWSETERLFVIDHAGMIDTAVTNGSADTIDFRLMGGPVVYLTANGLAAAK